MLMRVVVYVEPQLDATTLIKLTKLNCQIKLTKLITEIKLS